MANLISSIISGMSNMMSSTVETSGLGSGTATESTACSCGTDDTSCCNSSEVQSSPSPVKMNVIYSTQTNTAKKFANELQSFFESTLPSGSTINLLNIVDYDCDDLQTETAICVFVISTYNVEGPLDYFYKWLRDLRYDFRVERTALEHLRYAVFGLGDSAFGDDFCSQPRDIDKWLGQLAGTRIYPLGEGDNSADMEAQFNLWKDGIRGVICDSHGAGHQIVKHIEYDSDGEYESEDDDGEQKRDVGAGRDSGSGDEMIDVEDMGKMASKLQTSKQKRAEEEDAYKNRESRPKRVIGDDEYSKTPQVREMVSPMLHKALTKQGYKIVGTHSGVKICRWTKSALRGRGFCYKKTFYNIASHRCMEATPSLACANRCIFCWRHMTNPVGTEWRWKIDDPQFILDGAMENHYQMIKQLKGVPGVKAERFQEAHQIKHCALSLVGEPIFYPHINELVNKLHARGISTFLVTNAQFPDKIAELDPVTQLYVSVDASTKESLKRIDRPLFKDFWERFLDCLDQLSKKGQRTVYRLTLVKDFNTEELQNYAELIARGKPDFIEIKGVTYCGYSGASNLTMANVPYHQEVCTFVENLSNYLGHQYEIACEHAHSCSVLIAHTKFKINGEWHTWIDYDKFFELLKAGKPFNSLDYIAKTPEWALFGANEGGFVPSDERFFRKGKGLTMNITKDGGC